MSFQNKSRISTFAVDKRLLYASNCKCKHPKVVAGTARQGTSFCLPIAAGQLFIVADKDHVPDAMGAHARHP